ncbi:hypothetical protein HDF16_006067 [Granulicella aggregans]|uniref:Ig-like domain-containing protein n=1 Tax=Granulicella aggregans TaxID=474949 RepID=A0A7W7ZLB9_9BACT|nr:hypothetical protein [Granulicella aggregans]MBB5061331.1 hypothetical protein [Granulicella aggregans]
MGLRVRSISFTKLSLALLFLAAFCHIPTAAAQSISSNTYMTLTGGGSGGFITIGGGGVSFDVNVACTGNAAVSIYSSSTPDTAGSLLGSYTPRNTSGYVWTPTVAGTFYISAFLTLNGDTSCTGYGTDPSPVTAQWNVENP